MFISPFDEKKSFKAQALLFRKSFLPLHSDMCLSPIIRPGNNCSLRAQVIRYHDNKPRPVYASSKLGNRIEANATAFGKDTGSFIYVPCGRCPECLAAKQNSLVQRVQCESKYNHLFFCTLTYDNKHLPRLVLQVPVDTLQDPSGDDQTRDVIQLQFADADEIPQDVRDRLEQHDREIEDRLELAGIPSVSAVEAADPLLNPDVVDEETGECIAAFKDVTIPYADIHHIQLLMKNLRDNNPCDGRELRYLCVSELGKANGRPHFHILFIVEKRDDDYEWYNGVHRVKPSVSYNLERSLWKAVFKYWAINVGTRKNPIYEKLFTYRKRFYGQRVYTNFDLHYVDPTKTTDGTSNVAYYVTKYIMKGSERDRRRQQFLRLNLSEEQYRAAWNTIKCRMLASKGLGLDCRFYTIDKRVPIKNPDCSLCDYAKYLSDVICNSDDLPPDDLSLPSPVSYRIEKRRIMVPNFELASRLRSELKRDVGSSPGPIFISPDGKHRPLAHYYQTKSYIYTYLDFLDIYLNYDDSTDIPSYYAPPEFIQRKYQDHVKRLGTMERNSTFDTSPALLWGGEENIDDNNQLFVYGV